MADRMCCFGNCDNETVAVIVTIKGNPGERMVFCCLDHASYKLEAMATRQAAIRENRAAVPSTDRKDPDVIRDGKAKWPY